MSKEQEVLLANVRKWREVQAAAKLKAEFAERKRLAHTPAEPVLPKFKRLVEYLGANGLKGWMTAPGGASIDGK